MDKARYRNLPTSDYTIVRNSAARDARLSLKARGLLLLMRSYPPGWTFHLTHLETLMTDGRDSLRGAVRELEKFGYITRRQTRDEQGRLGSTDYYVTDAPDTVDGLSGDGLSGDGKTDDGKPATKKTYKKKTNYKKTEETPPEKPAAPELTRSPKGDERINYDQFKSTWNENRGNLPKILTLNDWRKNRIRQLHKQHEPQEVLEMFRAATRAVAADNFWITRQYGLDNLLTGNKILARAEQWQNTQGLTEGNRKLATTAARIARAIEGMNQND